MSRDLSKAQFLAALKRHGMKPDGFMGYVTVWRSEEPNGSSTHVCRHNGGSNLRAQLAYLLREQARAEREHEQAAAILAAKAAP